MDAYHYFYQQTTYTLKKESHISFKYYQELLEQEQVLFDEPEENDEKLEQQISQDEACVEDEYSIGIEELQLSVRAYNVLKRHQVNTVDDLMNYSPEDLFEIKNMGQKSADEIVKALYEKLGITLSSRS